LAVARRGLLVPDAFLPLAIEVFVMRETELHGGIHESVANRMFVAGIGHGQRSVGTVPVVLPAGLMLGTLEVRQYVGGRPAGIAELPPMIEVFVLAADVDHTIDRR